MRLRICLSGGAARFDNTGITDPSRYLYRVGACNTGGYSPYSGIVSVGD